MDRINGLNVFFDQLWALLKKNDCSPRLFAVPGHRDLVRPSGADPTKDDPFDHFKKMQKKHRA